MKKVKGLSLVTAAALLTSLAASPMAFAASTTASSATPSALVALGDSITFGFNLGNNQAPYPGAFPYLVGTAEGMATTSVDDEGVPGWTSSDLLKALQMKKYTTQLQQAKIVTIDIGNNDLLQAARGLLLEAAAGQPLTLKLADKLALQNGLMSIKQNLPQIIALVKQQTAPGTPIVVYNMYNPFTNATSLGGIAESMVTAANHIIAETAAQTGTVVAHAHAAFQGNQATYVRPMDVHPTIAGQQALAVAGEAALSTTYVSPTGSDITGTGTQASPYRTISYAVSKALEGATVVVEPGTYTETVNITKPVILTSANPTDATTLQSTVLDATGQNNGITITGPGASGTVIRGLTIENANNHGILVSDTSNVAILDNNVTANGAHPDTTIVQDKSIMLEGTSYSLVANNTVTGNATGGIAVTDLGTVDPGAGATAQPTASTATPAPGNTNWIVKNWINSNQNGSGIVIAAYNSGSNSGVSGNIVNGNMVSKNEAGIVIEANTPNSFATQNTVTNNTVSNNTLSGIVVDSNAVGDAIEATDITNNSLSGNGPDTAHNLNQSAGIALLGGGTPILDTIITNNQFSDEYYGVTSNAIGAVLNNNHFASSVTTPSLGATQLSTNQRVLYLNGQQTGTVGTFVRDNTTYVPIWYVMSALKAIGITSAWDGHNWHMTTSGSPDTAFSTIAQVSGSSHIYFNGSLVQNFTSVPIKDPNSGKATTYMPLYPLMQVLTAMGVQNTWDGTSWQLMAH